MSNLVSPSYIASTFKNISINSDLTLDKIKELQLILDGASKSIIIPVLKIEKKLKYKLDSYCQNYKEIKDKVSNALNEINLNENDKTDTMNITDLQLNHRNAEQHEELINLYNEISNKIELYTQLFKSEHYNKLIKEFDSLINDDEIFEKNEMKEIELIENENLKIKKKKNPKRNNNNSKNKNKKRLILSKDKKITSNNKKKKVDKDLLEILQEQFPTSNYVQKISKTFLRRRLHKKIIYKHEFKYSENIYEDERIRSSGESTVYKYGKIIFNFLNNDFSKMENLEEFMIGYLKQAFFKQEFNNEIIAGKINLPLNDLLNKVFKNDILRKDFNVEKVEINFFEFYEELVSEFNPKESNVRIENCDDKTLKNLLDDWNMLKQVREFVDKCKKEGLR